MARGLWQFGLLAQRLGEVGMTKGESRLEDAQSPWVPRPGTWERVLGSLPQTQEEEHQQPWVTVEKEMELPPDPPT